MNRQRHKIEKLNVLQEQLACSQSELGDSPPLSGAESGDLLVDAVLPSGTLPLLTPTAGILAWLDGSNSHIVKYLLFKSSVILMGQDLKFLI